MFGITKDTIPPLKAEAMEDKLESLERRIEKIEDQTEQAKEVME